MSVSILRLFCKICYLELDACLGRAIKYAEKA